MKVLVILAHPNSKSFNHAIAQTCVERLDHGNHEVTFHDLYAEKFDPVLQREEIPENGEVGPLIRNHCRDLMSCEGVVIIHPNWWGQPPAILKGWIDRVVRPGVAYNFREGDAGEGIPVGLLKANTALVFNTSNTSETRERKVFGDPLDAIWNHCIFSLCGIETFERRMFRIIVNSTPDQRRKWLKEVVEIIDRHFPAS